MPKDKFTDAIMWLDKQIAINRPKLKNVNPEQWRKDMYKSLYARSNQYRYKYSWVCDYGFGTKKANTIIKGTKRYKNKKTL